MLGLYQEEIRMIPLMKSTFYHEEKTKKDLVEFILKSDRLSMGPMCKIFEEKFSKYQGRKYSVFFNSGSSANLALIQSLINTGFLKKGDNVGFSALTWSTNVMPIIQLGLNPIPIDVSITNLNMTSQNLLESIKTHSLKAVFITNLLGFCGDLEEVVKVCDREKIILIEDNCESLGSELKGKKLGNFGVASSFSFFVGHHMSTIEGGMVCTDIKELYEALLIVRAHGWNRDLEEKSKQKLREKYNVDEFYDKYTFYSLGYVLRPTEITGFIGSEQLNYIDEICNKRKKNFRSYEKIANKNNDFQKLDFSHMSFVSNFAYPIICKDKSTRDRYLKKFSKKVEVRPIVGGSMTKQPFFKFKDYSCPNAENIHDIGFYIPNNPDLTIQELNIIHKLLLK